MKFSMLPGHVDLLKLMQDTFHAIKIEGRELDLGDFIKCTFNVGLLQKFHEPIYLKLGMALDRTKVYCRLQFEWPWPSLKDTQG